MSVQIGHTINIFGGKLTASDERNAQNDWQWGYVNIRLVQAYFTDGALWTSSRGMGGQFWSSGTEPILTSDCASYSGYYELRTGWDESGGQQVRKIIGVTLDADGNPLGNCIVQGFRTSDELFVGQVTSDVAGNYVLPTPYSTAHYIVAYKAGSPDVAGTSVNTIIPTFV